MLEAKLKFAEKPYLLLIMVAFANPAVAADDSLGKAISLFNKGQYAESIREIDKTKYQMDLASTAHYYRASAYAKLGNVSEAKRFYKLSRLTGPGGEAAKQAAVALKAYGEPVEDDGGGPTPAMSGVEVDPPALKKAVKQIVDQAEDRIKVLNSEGARLSGIRMNSAEKRAGQIESEGAAVVGSMQRSFNRGRVRSIDPFGSSSRYTRRFSVYSPDEIDAVRRLYQNRANSVRSGYKQDADNAVYEARSKALKVQESAEGLQSLLMQPEGRGGVYLKPEGTSLYVRNYDFAPSSNPPPVLPQSLRATPAILEKFQVGTKSNEQDKGAIK